MIAKINEKALKEAVKETCGILSVPMQQLVRRAIVCYEKLNWMHRERTLTTRELACLISLRDILDICFDVYGGDRSIPITTRRAHLSIKAAYYHIACVKVGHTYTSAADMLMQDHTTGIHHVKILDSDLKTGHASLDKLNEAIAKVDEFIKNKTNP